MLNDQFRIITGTGAFRSFATQESRDRAAQREADRSGQDVTIEFWDARNPQDHLNNGWACEGVVRPTQPPTGPGTGR